MRLAASGWPCWISDDIWLDSKLERQFAALRERPIGDKPLVSCNVMRSFEHQAVSPLQSLAARRGALERIFLTKRRHFADIDAFDADGVGKTSALR